MTIKPIEFMNLTQGTKSLTEYGLGPKLSKNMAGNKSTTFNEFMSDALTQENSNAIYAASKNRKRAYEAGPL